MNEGVAPFDPTTPVGVVRLMTGDTDPTNVVDGQGEYIWNSDTEIEALLGQFGGSAGYAAIFILRLVSITPAMILKKFTSADLAIDGPAITSALKLAIDGIEHTLEAAATVGNDAIFALVQTGPAMTNDPWWFEAWRQSALARGFDITVPFVV